MPVSIVKGNRISLNGYGNRIASPYGGILFTNGIQRDGRVISLPGLVAQKGIQLAGLKHGPKGNPFPAKVLQRPVLNVLQAKITVVVMILLLHALHGFLLAGLDERKQGEGVQGRILRRGQHILNPFVGFAAHVDEQIAGGNAGNIRSSGLIAVQVHATVQQQGQLHAGVFLSQN